MQEKYMELLAKTDYKALTSDEKELIKELCTNQSEFEQAKQLMNELNALDHEPHLFDSPKVKKRLDEEFKELYTSIEGGGWINFLFPPLKPIINRPGIQLALVFILFLGSYLFLELMDFNNTKTVQLAKNENKSSNENAEDVKDSEIDENLMSDKNKIDKIEIENNQSIAERSLSAEMDARLEPQKTALMIAPLISEESVKDNSVNEDLRTPGFNVSRADFEDEAPMANDSATEMGKFLIPTVQDNPDLLEGLFVTF